MRRAAIAVLFCATVSDATRSIDTMLATPDDFLPTVEQRAAEAPRDAVRLYFRGSELCVDDAGALPATPHHPVVQRELLIGIWRHRAVYACTIIPSRSASTEHRFSGLRALFASMPTEWIAIAGRAMQMLEWDRTHRYCGACATPTLRADGGRACRCPACGFTAYPRISPAMMCLVTRGEHVLLARNVAFPPGRFSALAGFLEVGESIEDAIAREVREEVGVEVRNPQYFASQSWPFPNSLMIAFTAEYASGELRPNGTEIAEADWFDHESLPQLPPRVSIARALIDDTVRQIRNKVA